MAHYDHKYNVQYFKIYAELAKKIMIRDMTSRMDEKNIAVNMISNAAAAAERLDCENDDDNDDGDDLTNGTESERSDRLYTFKELQYICLNVYQQELLQVCNLNEINNISEIGNCLDTVWDKIFTEPGYNERFKLLILRHQDMYFKELKHAPGIHRAHFAIMFDFDTFYIMHRCLGEVFSKNGNVSKELLDELEEELTRQKNNRNS